MHKRLWEELCTKLNSAGYGQRSLQKWQKAWTDYKFNLKRKAFDLKRAEGETSSGLAYDRRLTDLEFKVMSILGDRFLQRCRIPGTSSTSAAIKLESSFPGPNSRRKFSNYVRDDHNYGFTLKRPKRLENNIVTVHKKSIDAINQLNKTLATYLRNIDTSIQLLTKSVCENTDKMKEFLDEIKNTPTM